MTRIVTGFINDSDSGGFRYAMDKHPLRRQACTIQTAGGRPAGRAAGVSARDRPAPSQAPQNVSPPPPASLALRRTAIARPAGGRLTGRPAGRRKPEHGPTAIVEGLKAESLSESLSESVSESVSESPSGPSRKEATSSSCPFQLSKSRASWQRRC